MSTALSQNVGKRTNGKKRTHANVADINARSRTRYHSDTGSAYTVVNSSGLIKVEFAQTGSRHEVTRSATVGTLTESGFKSHAAIAFMGHHISWEDLVALIGMSQEALMRSVAKFARSQFYQGSGVSSTSRYSHEVRNRQKRDCAKRQAKGIRIC
ncbi:hypothetical protein [Allocoleopsis sp.]|uniref:hypothetical protein n=1 Tax=Allocoleopsis sp. TaxID=3088169 RepID=UPI002FD56D82